MKYIIAIIILINLFSRLMAQMAVEDASVLAQMAKQFAQDTEKLQQLKNQLQTAKSLYDTAQSALKYQGNPASTLGGIKDSLLGGSLGPSNIGATFNQLLGSVGNISTISSQLQNLLGGPSISVESIKSQLLTGQSPPNNIAKYKAIESLFDQQRQQLQSASAQSSNLRTELGSLREQIKNSQDQATTEKLQAAIDSTAAALASSDATISQLQQQTQLSIQMVQNRKLMEEASYQEAYKQVSDQQSQESAVKRSQAVSNLHQTR